MNRTAKDVGKQIEEVSMLLIQKIRMVEGELISKYVLLKFFSFIQRKYPVMVSPNKQHILQASDIIGIGWTALISEVTR